MNPPLGYALVLCLALAAQSRGQSPEAAKTRSGILFGEGTSAAGEAVPPAVRDRVLEAGSPLPRPGTPGRRAGRGMMSAAPTPLPLIPCACPLRRVRSARRWPTRARGI